MERLDCLLIHTPKFNNYYRLFGDFIHMMYIPMGLFSIADCLNKNGFKARILHLGIEWLKNKKFQLTDYLAQTRPGIVGLSLHFHHQSYDVIQVAKRIKSFDPNIFVVLGGYTASIFDREILENFPEVDAIIRGDGEIPFLRLCEKRKEFNFGDVPNLTWRKGQKIVRNEVSFVAAQENLDKFSWTNLSFLNNYKSYLKLVGNALWFKNIPQKMNNWTARLRWGFPLLVGKGCPANCSYCGGSSLTQKKFTNRHKVIFRSQEAVIDSILELKKYGYNLINICFDPYPTNPSYYLELFRKIRQKNIKIGCTFACYRLPTKKFLEEFKQTFGWSRFSFLDISPESGSEEVRRLNKGFYYTNAELTESVEAIDKMGIPLNIYFSLGLPFGNRTTLTETARLIKRLRKFRCIREIIWSILDIDPGSPCFLFPDKYGVNIKRKNFVGFFKTHQSSYKMANPSSRFTKTDYCVKDFLDNDPESSSEDKFERFEGELQKIKCKYSCYFWSKYSIPVALRRMICGSLNLIWKLRRKINEHIAF